jgi:hypothetical protein
VAPMNRGTCQCGEPATRLIKVVHADGEHKGRMIFSMDRSNAFACCEPHRASAKQILADAWAEEIAAKTAKVLMGKRHKKGL